MSERASALAKRIEAGAEALAAFVEGFSDAEWERIVPNEGRPVGVLVHHVANSYQAEVDLASLLAAGKPITGVTWDMIDGINADHAEEFAKVSKEETVDLLRKNAKAAAARVRAFSDEELNRAERVSLNANAPLTAQFFIEDHALRHSYQHLESIQETLK
jgi:hypothetical protein